MKNLLVVIPVIFLYLSSYSTTNAKSPELSQSRIPQNQNLNQEEEGIELNNGEKWKIDTNMIIHIRNMEKDIASFGKSEQKEYKSLSRKLQANINLLTSNCTMKGKAHDELHKWLLPYIKLVNEFTEADNKIDAEKKYQDIKTSFTTFNQYFQ